MKKLARLNKFFIKPNNFKAQLKQIFQIKLNFNKKI